MKLINTMRQFYGKMTWQQVILFYVLFNLIGLFLMVVSGSNRVPAEHRNISIRDHGIGEDGLDDSTSRLLTGE